MRLSINPRHVRIHVWGGLGSQLFAYSLKMGLSEKFHNRKLIMVFHTAGISKRHPEILSLVQIDDYEVLDDFVTEDSNLQSRNHIGYWVREFVRRILSLSGFLATANNDFEFAKISKRVISIRGHYSHRTVGRNFLWHLNELLNQNPALPHKEYENSIVIHYRLGDLLNLTDKGPVNSKSLSHEILGKINQLNPQGCVVFSDSPEEAEKLLSLDSNLNFCSLKSSSIILLYAGCKGLHFVGTNSKLSYWVISLRSQLYEKCSSIPLSQKSSISTLVANSSLVSYF